MAHVHGLGHVRAAVVDQDAARVRHLLRPHAGVGGDRLGAFRQGGVGELQVDEARAGDLHRRQPGIAGQPSGHGGGDLARVPAHALGGGQRPVGLEVGEVGTVRSGDAAQLGRQPFSSEGGLYRFAQALFQVAHRRFAASPEATAVAPAFTRKRLPWRLNSAICGVTSKPTRISKLAPEVVVVPRGITMLEIESVT